MNTVKFLGENCSVVFGRYRHNDQLAISLLCEDGSPMATATAGIDHDMLKGNITAIKDYSENTGMLAALIEAGIVRATTLSVQGEFVNFPIVEVLVDTGGV